MNLQTREFIWGLVLLLVGGSALVIHIINLIDGKFEYGWDWLLLAGSLYATIDGYIKICKTTS